MIPHPTSMAALPACTPIASKRYMELQHTSCPVDGHRLTVLQPRGGVSRCIRLHHGLDEHRHAPRGGRPLIHPLKPSGNPLPLASTRLAVYN
jgi:hypothetical protein